MSAYPQRCCAAWRVPPVRLAISAQLYPSLRTAVTASVICPSSSERSAIRWGSASMSVPALRPAALTMRRTKAMYSAVSIGRFTCQGCIDDLDKSMHCSAYSCVHNHPLSCMKAMHGLVSGGPWLLPRGQSTPRGFPNLHPRGCWRSSTAMWDEWRVHIHASAGGWFAGYSCMIRSMVRGGGPGGNRAERDV